MDKSDHDRDRAGRLVTAIDLAKLNYSSPGSRWVDPALGFDPAAMGLPSHFEATWTIGSDRVQTSQPLGMDSEQDALIERLLRLSALFVANLHETFDGRVKLFYYVQEQAPGFAKLRINSDIITSGFSYDIRTYDDAFFAVQKNIYSVVEKVRWIKARDKELGGPPSTFRFADYLFGEDDGLIFAISSIHPLRRPVGFFNFFSIRFLAHYCRS